MAGIPQIAPGGDFNIPRPAMPAIAPGAGVEGMTGAAEELAGQAAALGAHFKQLRNTIQFNQADAESAEMMDQARAKVMLDPQFRNDPDAAQAETTRQLGDIQQQIIQKYPYADVHGALSKNLAIRTSHYAFSNFLDAHANQEKDLRQQSAALADSVVEFAANPASDPKEVGVQINNYAGKGGRIDQDVAQGLFTPGEGALRKQVFSGKLATAQFQSQAFIAPEKVLTMTAPPVGVTPEKFEQTMRLAADRLDANQRAVEAGLTADQGKLEKEIQADANAGKPIGAKLEAFGSQFSSAPGGREFYEAYARHPYRPSGDPAVARALDDGIMDGHADRTTILSALASSSIDARQAAVLESKIQTRDRDLKSVMGAAKYRAWGEIEHEINSSFFTDPGVKSEARNAFMAEAEGAKKPSDYDEIKKKLIDKYAPVTAIVAPSAAKASIANKLKGTAP